VKIFILEGVAPGIQIYRHNLLHSLVL